MSGYRTGSGSVCDLCDGTGRYRIQPDVACAACDGTGTKRKTYRTIVADPPWHYERFGISRIPKGAEHDGRAKRLPYQSMTVEEIKALPVNRLAKQDAHLYLWTTNRYLRDAFDVLHAWGFRYGQTVVWAKKFKGGVIGGSVGAARLRTRSAHHLRGSSGRARERTAASRTRF